MPKTRQENNVTDCTGVVYAKNGIKLSWPIGSDATVTKTKLDNDVIDLSGLVYAENEIELSWPIRPSVVWDENQIR